MLGPAPSASENKSTSIVDDVEALQPENKYLHTHRKKKIKKKVKNNYAELLNMTVLKKIRKSFVDGKYGGESLAVDEFCDVLAEFIPRVDVDLLYKKIDINDDGMIDWEEFTGFLTTSEGGVDLFDKSGILRFVLQREQQPSQNYYHTDMIEHIAYSKAAMPILATAGCDGQVLLWNPKNFQPIGSIDHRDKSDVYLEDVKKSMAHADVARMQAKGAKFSSRKIKSYITSLIMMPFTGHICLSTADCCVTVYDSPSLELTGRMSISDIPTHLNAFVIMDKIRLKTTQYLVIGSSSGKIIVITLDENFVLATDGPLPKKTNQDIWNNAVKHKMKWKIHDDWVTQVMYVKDINRLVTASLDGTIKLCTLDKQPSVRTFNGHESGVRCFTWSNTSKILCSVGTDRRVLIWDPFTLQVAHRIESLQSTVIRVEINDAAQQLFIVMQDKTIKAWDSLTYESLITSQDPSVQVPRNEISSSLWVPEIDTLYTAGNRLCSLRPAGAKEELVVDEDDDICKVLYNFNFYEVITVTRTGWVNVYYVGDGTSESNFQIASGSQSEEGKSFCVLDAVLDKVQRRLFVATNDNNEIQIWNFHNGQCLKSIRPRILNSLSQHDDIFPTEEKMYNITCLHYDYTLWSNQKVNKRLLLFGTDVGAVSVHVELPDDIPEEPSFNLVAHSNIDSGGNKKSENKRRLSVKATHQHFKAKAAEVVDVSIHSQSSVHSKQKEVLWIRESFMNNILVAYSNGTAIEWDLDKAVKNINIKASAATLGISFLAFRRKFPNPDRLTLVFDAKKKGNIIQNSEDVKELESTQEEPQSSSDRVEETDLVLPMDEPRPPFKVQEKEARKAGTQLLFSESNAPKKLKQKVRINGPKRISSSERSRNLLATYGSHCEKQMAVAESGQEAWKTNAGAIGYSGAIIGVARSPRRVEGSLHPLLPDILTPRSENPHFCLPSSIAGKSKLPLNNYGRPSHDTTISAARESKEGHLEEAVESLVAEKEKGTAQETEKHADAPSHHNGIVSVADSLEEIVPSTPLTHTQHKPASHKRDDEMPLGHVKQTSNQIQIDASESTNKIGIISMVCLKISRIAIGACSDCLFRFWDLDTAKVVCSCSVGLELKTLLNEKDSSRATISDTQLSSLALSHDEELLIGGYESGEIRVWIVSIASINKIRHTKKEFISGMSIPPIQLLSEWTAHESLIRSIDPIQLDEENWGSHELYLVSSGQDQEVHLWSISGEKIGTFGSDKGWSLDDKSTWAMNKSKFAYSMMFKNQPKAPPKSKKPSYLRGNTQHSFKIDPNDKSTNHFRMAVLHHHMEKVKIKNQKKLTEPSTTEIHYNMVIEAQDRYPIADVGDLSKPCSSPRGKSASKRRRPTSKPAKTAVV